MTAGQAYQATADLILEIGILRHATASDVHVQALRVQDKTSLVAAELGGSLGADLATVQHGKQSVLSGRGDQDSKNTTTTDAFARIRLATKTLDTIGQAAERADSDRWSRRKLSLGKPGLVQIV